MGLTSMISLFCSLLVVSVGASDILQMLDTGTDEYTTFAKLLTDTKLVDEINSQPRVTVLALSNAAANAITSLPSNLQKKVLSLHVLLDRYDPLNLDDGLKKNNGLVTTLFHLSGQATGQMGYLKYTNQLDETQVFGSAVPGAPLDSEYLGIVTTRSENILVLEVSKAIIPPGLDGACKEPHPPSPSA